MGFTLTKEILEATDHRFLPGSVEQIVALAKQDEAILEASWGTPVEEEIQYQISEFGHDRVDAELFAAFNILGYAEFHAFEGVHEVLTANLFF